MKVKLNITSAIKKLNSVAKVTQQVAQDAYKVFYKTTPEKTGNARSKTRLKGKTIEANYPYAGVLDKGRRMTPKGMRGSRQAPRGMSRPTLEYIKKQIKRRIRKQNG